jgi:hypothetical protein
MLCLGLLGAVLAGVTAIAGAQPPPVDHYPTGVPGMDGTEYCKKTFPNGLRVPDRSESTLDPGSPHQYVLLLVFKTKRAGENAGVILFHADRPLSNHHRTTVGCVADPADDGKLASTGKGITVQGDCPTDCTLHNPLYSKLKVDQDRPDPLGDEGTNWGIFSGPMWDKKNANIAVWQIRVTDAHHAHQILDELDRHSELSHRPGFLGHLLIGYRPDPSLPHPAP